MRKILTNTLVTRECRVDSFGTEITMRVKAINYFKYSGPYTTKVFGVNSDVRS